MWVQNTAVRLYCDRKTLTLIIVTGLMQENMWNIQEMNKTVAYFSSILYNFST